MPNTATRLITLIMLLQSKPNLKAGYLAEQLSVSVRSVHRYIGMLEEMGIPIYSERGPQGGFSLLRGYKMPPLVFTPQEAVSVYLGTSLVEEMWGQLYGEAARAALAKMENVLPDEQRHEVAWARKKLVATAFHRTDQEALAPLLEKIRRAIRERRRLQLVYRGRNQPQAIARDLDAYALVHRWGWWYVVGCCALRKDLRTFRVDRMQHLTLLDRTFSDPAGFDIHNYLETSWQEAPPINVRMRFSAEHALVALDDRWNWHAYREHDDGSVEVDFMAPDENWAASTALAYSGAAEVLEPASIRRLVAGYAAAIAELHGTGSRETTES